MLELSKNNDIIKVKIEDAEISCRPYKSEYRTIAKLKASKAILELQKQRADELEQGVETKLPDFDDIEIQNGIFICIFNTELAKQVIIEWQGIGQNGKALEPTPDNIELLMADGVANIQEQFINQYMALQRKIEEEKK